MKLKDGGKNIMNTTMTVEETFSVLNRQFGVMNIKQLNELPPVNRIYWHNGT